MADHASPHPTDPSQPARPCQNCGATLTGPYCAKCGQQDVDYHRSFHHLFHDILENVFHFEGKFFATVAWLLARPGRLTREFIAGHRQSQLNPLRFYLFVSVLFFLGLTLLNHGHVIDFDRREADQLTKNVQAGMKAAEKADGTLTADQIDEAGRLIGDAIGKKGGPLDQKAIAEIVESVRRKPAKTSATGNPPSQSGTKITFDRRSALGRILAEKLGSGELRVSTIIDELEHRIPTLIFLGVPLFALLLKLAYVRTGRFYIEHLIFSLHLHTWLFLVAMVSDGYLRLAALGAHWLLLVGGWTLAAWMAWYLVASFRAVYGQSWVRSIIKPALLGLAYGYLLLIAGFMFLLATVYQLTLE